ncbi:hypothetical protein K3G63_03905 [Hymenobacter sp. HSC-4F20]|uniref:NHL repeat-containing protein n=1 Tax=Hymenobacter sp. HSC-4F20 TaxID=2864135 RepID=UPI001C7370C9|nr:NHL repeat-containing protein [Hymenobacter sp. HSC-4F20]MBX0289566.1 hypothetical protein [Hymenobacter sp. HSC-4F20]
MKLPVRPLWAIIGILSIASCKEKSPQPVAAPVYVVSTLAGTELGGFQDGSATTAQFSSPGSVAADAQGNVYVADYGNSRIRKISPAGVVSTYAGTGGEGYVDGPVGTAQIYYPNGLATDAQGNVYVTQYGDRIRKITPSGVVSTLAGNGYYGYADGAATEARFRAPSGPVIDAQGNMYVADGGNNCIRKISPAGVVSTLAGSAAANSGFADGAGPAARFFTPTDVTIDCAGNLLVADFLNNRIRKISPAGVVSTLAGSGELGYADGNAAAAQFSGPAGVAADCQGNVYVADMGNHRIRRISADGQVSTVAGNGERGYADGVGNSAQIAFPSDVTLDASGTLYVANGHKHRIRKITVQ